MTAPAPPDPLTDLLRATPRGAAMFLAAEARTRLREAAGLTPAILKAILLTLIIPAEALARRIILAVAARLPMPVPPSPRAPSAPAGCKAPLPPAAPSYGNLKPAFRMLETPPAVRAGASPKPAANSAPGKAASVRDPAERLALQVFRRLNAVIHALDYTTAEARRFLRRRAAKGETAPPLAFGAPPGLEAAALDPVLSACLLRSDAEAETAWAQLCNTS
ncbi:MAG: hypothetical protein IPK75_12215 [Acidobacteria bacterium]|jgi:hypothetical protein|nr:hypothetical protein [Acidobacteriota bacterium]